MFLIVALVKDSADCYSPAENYANLRKEIYDSCGALLNKEIGTTLAE
jgi:hypothetical protein